MHFHLLFVPAAITVIFAVVLLLAEINPFSKTHPTTLEAIETAERSKN